MSKANQIILKILLLSIISCNQSSRKVADNDYCARDTLKNSEYGMLVHCPNLNTCQKYLYRLRGENYQLSYVKKGNKLYYTDSLCKKTKYLFLNLNSDVGWFSINSPNMVDRILVFKDYQKELQYYIEINARALHKQILNEFDINDSICFSAHYKNKIFIIENNGNISDVGEYFISPTSIEVITINGPIYCDTIKRNILKSYQSYKETY